MHPRTRPPIFVPAEFVAELERLTKPALMDLLWDFIADNNPGNADDAIAEIRKRAAYIVTYRDQQ